MTADAATHEADRLRAALRAWAAGVPQLEAVVELLLRVDLVVPGAPWVTEFVDGTVQAEGHELANFIDDPRYSWSDEQRRIGLIAASLLEGPPVDLGEIFIDCEQASMDLTLAAFAQSGGHPHMHPWPEPA